MAHKVVTYDEVIAVLGLANIHPTTLNEIRENLDILFCRRDEVEIDEVRINSGFGTKSQKGFVDLTINDQRTQMVASKAMEIGLMLVTAAEAAISDEIFMSLLEELGLGNSLDRGAVLLKLREIRHGSKNFKTTH